VIFRRHFDRCVIHSALIGFGLTAAATFLSPSSVFAAPSAAGASKLRGQKGNKGQKGGAKDGPKGKEAKKKSGSALPARSPAAAPVEKATTAKPGAATPIELNLALQRAALDNGLRVVLNPDHTSPTVAVAVTYDVGSRNELRGRSGFAHLFEHMMFQGSRNVARGEHFQLVASHGGVLNGTTSADRTNYFEILPANELALGLWLEADRMKSLQVNEANFENQRKVVQEEYRMRVSNAAYAPSGIRLEELVYQGYWPYEHDPIGSMADLDGAKLEWVQEFHDHRYGPNNAVLSISGDFNPEEAMGLVHRYFDGAARIDVAPFEETPFPEQTSQRTAVLRDDNARTPGILYGWAIPPARAEDHYALELVALLLGDGESARLHQLLVRDKAVAQQVSASTEDRRGPDLFTIDARLTEGAKVGDVEKLLEGELKSLATRGPSDAEMEKARRQVQAEQILSLQSNIARALQLGEYETYFGDARLLNAELPRYLAVTKEDIKRVTAQHLGPTRRSIVETYPTENSGAQDRTKAGAKSDKAASANRSEPAAEGKKGGAKNGAKASAAEAKGKKGAAAAPKAKKPKK
jgi:zinc protease